MTTTENLTHAAWLMSPRPNGVGQLIDTSDPDRTYVETVRLAAIPEPGTVVRVVMAQNRYAPRTPGVAAPPHCIGIDFPEVGNGHYEWRVEVHPYVQRLMDQGHDPLTGTSPSFHVRLRAYDKATGESKNRSSDHLVYIDR